MTVQYLRAYQLQILVNDTNYIIEDNRINFYIIKTSASESNTTVIKIYNLQKEVYKRFEENNAKIILKCGYVGQLSTQPLQLLFSGDITHSYTTRQKADIVTHIEAGDGNFNLTEKFTNRTFVKNKNLKDLLKLLIKDLDISYNDLSLSHIDNNKKVNVASDISVSGRTKEIIDNLIKTEGLEWSIQNNEFTIYSPDQSINENESVYVFNDDTGLLELKIKKDNKIEFTALINPAVTPTKLIKIEDSLTDTNSFYKMERVTYDGDSFDGQWIMKCEGISNDS